MTTSQTQVTAPALDRSTVVGSSSALVLTANPNRRYLFIQNTSDQNIGINITGGEANIGGAGTIVLEKDPNAGNSGDAYECPPHFITTSAINAISASGSGKNLVIIEG